MENVSHSVVSNFATPWTVACQGLLPMGFSRQEYWSGLPFSSPGDLPNLEIEPRSPVFQADSLPSEPPGNVCSTLIYLGTLKLYCIRIRDAYHISIQEKFTKMNGLQVKRLY